MPTRHGKNNTANSFFSYEEKRKLKWGTQKRRAGKDSIKDWDACALCLHQAVCPLVTPKGHIFCQECIFACLLAQKKAIKRKQRQFEEQQLQDLEESHDKRVQEEEEKLEKFGEQETGILLATSLKKKKNTTLDANTGYRKLITSRGKEAYVPDLDMVAASAAKPRFMMTKEEKEIQKRMCPAFWVPELTPHAAKPKLKPPSRLTMCPAGDHPLRLKQLTKLNLVLSDASLADAKQSHKSGRYMCPNCRKALINSGTQYALKNCGHVLCKTCLVKFVMKDKRCPVCSEKCRKKHVIEIQRGSSGFAAGGAFTAKSKVTPAFCSF